MNATYTVFLVLLLAICVASNMEDAETRVKRRGLGDIIAIGPTTCISIGGGSKCRKTCQGIMASSTKKCYCTGSCEPTLKPPFLVCKCLNPTCPCGPHI